MPIQTCFGSSDLFYVNLFQSFDFLSTTPIGDNNLNLNFESITPYIADISNYEVFKSIGFQNNKVITDFYSYVVAKFITLDNAIDVANFVENQEYKQTYSSNNNIFVLSTYKDKVPPRNCVSIVDGTVSSNNLIGVLATDLIGGKNVDFLNLQPVNYIGADTSSLLGLQVKAKVIQYNGIYLNDYIINLPYIKQQSLPSIDTGEDTLNLIRSNYSFCKVFVFAFSNYDFSSESTYYSTYVLVVRDTSKNYSYDQDFTDFIDNIYPDSISVDFNSKLYPFSVIADNQKIYRGVISKESLFKDAFFEAIDFTYPKLCSNSDGNIITDPPSFTPNTMTCISNNRLQMQYNGNPIATLDDAILCNGEARTAYIRIDKISNSFPLFYKDLPSFAECYQIYAYNFDYIKLLKSDNSLETIEGNGTVQTSTQFFNNKTLDFNDYYSYQFDSLNRENGFIFTFLFRATNATSTTDYPVDFNPLIQLPTVSLIHINSSQVEVTTNYGTSLVYYFENENPTTVAITDTTNGTNQKTLISTNGKYGTLHVEVRNYFYDLVSDLNSKQIFSASTSINVENNISISTFKFTINRSNSPTVDSVFYDSGGNSLTKIEGTNFLQTDPLGYIFYSLDTNSNGFLFRFTYTYSGKVYIKVGNLNKIEIKSGEYQGLSKEELFKQLDSKNNIDIKTILEDGTEFVFPFTFKTYYLTNPTVSNVSINKVTLSNSSLAFLVFSYDYSLSDGVSYEILDQDQNEIFTTFESLEYSSNTNSKTYTVEVLNIENLSSITVKVTTQVLFQTGGIETIKTATASSSSYSLPQRLNSLEPATIKFYSDAALTSEITEFRRAQKIYAKLILKDISNNEISTSSYGQYIVFNDLTPSFKIIGFENTVIQDLGVRFSKINAYTYSLFINPSAEYEKNSIGILVDYTPIIQ